MELREQTRMTWQGWLLLFLLLSFYLAIFDRVNPIYYLEPNHSHARHK
jgi:hypothetical protein